MSAAEERGSPRRELTGRHVLLALMGFFGVVFAVNGVFLGTALSTYTGVVSKEPYVKGLHYNARIAAEARQAELGWTEATTVSAEGEIVATVADAAGQPVRDLVLAGSIGRPATSRLDRQVVLREAAPGRYVASVGALEAGTWLLSLETRGKPAETDPIYRLKRRIWVKQ